MGNTGVNVAGVWIRGGDRNRIGTDGDGIGDADERNIISATVGNIGHGILIGNFFGHSGVPLTSHNVIAGNHIGTDVSGTVPFGNQGPGIRLHKSDANRIGTDGDGLSDALERNVIAGNKGEGILAISSLNVIAGNYVGIDATGTVPMGNTHIGVSITGNSNRVGTDGNGVADATERNVIAANKLSAVAFIGDNNVVAGNYLGTDVAGTAALGNGGWGVSFSGNANRIGTVGNGAGDIEERNIISGNAGPGVGFNGNDNTIAGNFIGTDFSGTIAPAMEAGGISGGGDRNRIGTNGNGISDALERNVISGNKGGEAAVYHTGSDNIIAGNYIGVDSTGAAAMGNTGVNVAGVWIRGGDRNRIGTDGDGIGDADERNIISATVGNIGHGILIGNFFGHSGVPLTSHNVIAGNHIGTDASGTVPFGNQGPGIRLHKSDANRIGTNGDGLSDALERNVIAGNKGEGILAISSLNVIAGNYVGIDATGTVPMGNTHIGVSITGNSNRVGTDGNGIADATERNVIAANRFTGIGFTGNDNVVAGNYIGTDVTGTVAIDNGGGVGFSGDRNRIGTIGDGMADAAERNLITASSRGVGFTGTNNVVAGNYIGVDFTGMVKLVPTAGMFIGLEVSGNFSRIGTDGNGVGDADEKNVISATTNNAVEIYGDFNVFAGNFVGTNAAGTSAIGALEKGVALRENAQHNRLGTDGNGVSDAAERNLISGNFGCGIVIHFGDASENVVAGNFIGTDVTGTSAIPNACGISIDSQGFTGNRANRIGTNGDGIADEAERNVISGNNGIGIHILFSSENIVAGNFIGTDSTGTVALPNNGEGIRTAGGDMDRIGTDADGVAGCGAEPDSTNTKMGIEIGSANTTVAGNYIGTDITGTLPLGNDAPGVALKICSGTVLGGPGVRGNIIAYNLGAGVVMTNPAATGCRVQGNSIRSNGQLGIDILENGVTPNDSDDVDAGPNNSQNFPVLTLVQGGPSTRVVGTLNSTPNSTFTLDFYANSTADPSRLRRG